MSTPNIREMRRQRALRDDRSPILLRLLIVLAVLYVIYLLAGFFVAPSVIKSQIEARASERLKREVRVGKVAFNPLTLSLTLERLLVLNRERQPEVGWASLFVNFELWSLVTSEIHFAEISLDGFATQLHVSKEGVLNVADMLRGGIAEESPAEGGHEWALRIDRLAVNRAEIAYTDESRGETFSTQVGPTTFVLREFRTRTPSGAKGVFTAVTEAGEDVEWTGRLALAPLRSSGELRLRKLELAKYAPFYANAVNFDIVGGTLDLQVPYEFSIQDNKPQLRVSEAQAKVDALALAEKGKTERVVELNLIEVGPLSLDLQGRSGNVGRIVLTGGNLTVVRGADGLNLSRLAGSPSARDERASGTPAPASGAAPWELKVEEVTGRGISVALSDTTTLRPGALQLQQATFSAKQLASSELGNPVPVQFRSELASGGVVQVSGTAILKPLVADLTYTLDGVALAAFSPWLETVIVAELKSGVANVRGGVQLRESADDGMAIVATTDGDISSVDLVTASGDPLVRWQSLALVGAEYTTTPARATAGTVTLTAPQIHVVRQQGGVVNVSTLMRSSGQPPAPEVALPDPTQPPGLFVAVDRFAIENATLSFVDRSVQPEVSLQLDRFGGAVTGLSSAAIDRAEVDLNGRLVGRAPVSITGRMNVLAGAPALDLRIELKGAELAPIEPYFSKYVGYALTSGGLSVDGRAKMANNRIDSAATVVVTNLTLGEPSNSPDAPNVPVNIALALLRDREGKIVFDVPIQGSLADPNFQLGGAISRVIGNVITKAATSPFSIIGAMFGGGSSGDDLSHQDFTPGSDELDDQDRSKLDVVARALQERPALRLQVTGGYDAAVDLPPLREQELEERIRTSIWEQARRINPDLVREDVVVSRDAAARVIAEFYREAFVEPLEQGIGASEAEGTPETQAEPEERRRFFLFRWFLRDPPPQPPAPAPKPNAAPVVRFPGEQVPPGLLPIEADMRSRLLAAVPIGDAEMRALAQGRAERVRSYMLQQAPDAAERIDVSPELDSKSPRASLQLR